MHRKQLGCWMFGLVVWLGAAAWGADNVLLRWRADLADALASARGERRPVVAFVSSDSCPHCVLMKQRTLGDPQVLRELSRDFLAVQVNAPHSEDFLARHDIRAYPTTLVFDPQGRVVSKMVGFVGPEAFRAKLRGLRVDQAQR